MKTALCDALGIAIPIVQAPMGGGVVGPKLAAAVCNAGGLGTLPLWRANDEALRKQIRATRDLTDKPFAVNLNLEFPQEERLAACLQEGVKVISFFWRDPSALVVRVKAGGAIVMHTVSSALEAEAAVRGGVDIVVAQGWEAGGHVRGTVATMALVPAVVDAVAPRGRWPRCIRRARRKSAGAIARGCRSGQISPRLRLLPYLAALPGVPGGFRRSNASPSRRKCG
jgi:NAD(P)H-dependent flavin oxidoreductase YrpB (nitropropane dioxygenase family)